MLADKTHPNPSAVAKVFETRWFSLEALSYESMDEPYYRISCNDSVAVFPMTKDRKIVLIRQYRPAIGLMTLELPAGDIGEGETPETAARREMEEESGFTCGALIPAGLCRVAPDRINAKSHVFFAPDAVPLKTLKSERDIETHLVSEDEFKAMVIRGDFAVVSGIAIYTILKLRGFLDGRKT